MESTSAAGVSTTSLVEATAEFRGSLVRIDCGEEGVYQGIVLEVDPEKAYLKIKNPFRNGVSLDNLVVQIPGELVKEVLVVRIPSKKLATKKDAENTTGKIKKPATKRDAENTTGKIKKLTTTKEAENTGKIRKPETKKEAENTGKIKKPETKKEAENTGKIKKPETKKEAENTEKIKKPAKKKEAENTGKITPRSDVVQRDQPVSSNTNLRHRRITCAERMVMINQRQQQKTPMSSEGSNVQSGTQTFAKNRPVPPRFPSVQSNTVQIYMQSACKTGRTLMARIPSRSNDSRFSSSKTSPGTNQKNNNCNAGHVPASVLLNQKNQQNPGSVRIMQKLFSPIKSKKSPHKSEKKIQEFDKSRDQQQFVPGQRIDINDLLKGCVLSDVPSASALSSEPPSVSLPRSSASTENREGFKSPLRRSLSATLVTSLNAGSATFRVHHNRSPVLMAGGNSTCSMPSYHRSSPTDVVRSSHYKRRSFPNSSSPPAAVARAPLAHQAFGEFKLFKEQQQAMPMRLHVNHRRNVRGEFGPTGIPAVDCSNGYRSYSDRLSETIMGDPLDPNMETDFDFVGNLALFDKAEFNRETEHIFHELDSAGDCSRNYRNDENVLQDASRVISWTKSGITADDDDDDNNPNTSTSSQTG
uniref:DFDF domain-containing protein n=1 Tax=Globodera rostochiensis TaxID=31243 RepID=A0A914GV04_GLORO